jgi:hypothetical protein
MELTSILQMISGFEESLLRLFASSSPRILRRENAWVGVILFSIIAMRAALVRIAKSMP